MGGAWGGVASPAKLPPTASRAGVAVYRQQLANERNAARAGCTFIPCARLVEADKVNRLEGSYTLLPTQSFKAAAASVGLPCGMGWAVVLWAALCIREDGRGAPD